MIVMKSSIKKPINKLLMIVVAFFLITTHFQRVAFSQTDPLTIDQISRAISKAGKDKTILKKIVNDIRSRGTDFRITSENYARLRKDGVTDEILFIIQMSIDFKKNCDEPIDRFSKIIQSDSKNAQAFFDRGKSHIICALHSKMAEGNEIIQNQANKDLDQAKMDFEQAKMDFDKAIELNPELSTKVAPSYVSIGKINQSVVEITKALELDPELYDGYIARADIFKNKKDYDKAIIDYNKAIEIRPDTAIPHTNRGLCYFYKQDYDSALKDFNKAIEVAPDFPDNYRRRADLYDRIRKKDLAQEDRKTADEIEKGIK